MTVYIYWTSKGSGGSVRAESPYDAWRKVDMAEKRTQITGIMEKNEYCAFVRRVAEANGVTK